MFRKTTPCKTAVFCRFPRITNHYPPWNQQRGYPWKWVVGRWYFPFGSKGLFSEAGVHVAGKHSTFQGLWHFIVRNTWALKRLWSTDLFCMISKVTNVLLFKVTKISGSLWSFRLSLLAISWRVGGHRFAWIDILCSHDPIGNPKWMVDRRGTAKKPCGFPWRISRGILYIYLHRWLYSSKAN